MPLYDARCNDCGHEFEERRKYDDPVSDCPQCFGPCKNIWKSVSLLDKAKDPYDYLDGPIPDPKPIKSFANDRRTKGKDTT